MRKMGLDRDTVVRFLQETIGELKGDEVSRFVHKAIFDDEA
jgi:hypothetical protein